MVVGAAMATGVAARALSATGTVTVLCTPCGSGWAYEWSFLSLKLVTVELV
jgi:predicted TIM-barrel enzyme